MIDVDLIEDWKCPSCESPLEERRPVCKDGQESCGCDRVFRCEQCDRSWYWSCVKHDYGDEELRDEGAAN